jgi:hypothetical protein
MELCARYAQSVRLTAAVVSRSATAVGAASATCLKWVLGRASRSEGKIPTSRWDCGARRRSLVEPLVDDLTAHTYRGGHPGARLNRVVGCE